jgi:GST-like protein
MIDLYAFQTSNGQRAAIALEECGLPYTVHRVDLTKGEQKGAEFLKINPAGAIPAIVDAEGPGGRPLMLSQSGAILLYAAEKSGRFLPADGGRRALALQWMMFALTDCAPATGYLYYLGALAPEKSPANLAWLEGRLLAHFRLADARLTGREYLADEISVADFALYPVVAARRALVDAAGDLPNLVRWAGALAARPGVARAMKAV